jgi:hypothetical protein
MTCTSPKGETPMSCKLDWRIYIAMTVWESGMLKAIYMLAVRAPREPASEVTKSLGI